MSDSEDRMMAVLTTGNGGYEKLVYSSVPKPIPGPNEVLLRVLAAGVNNTDINTRLGWYSSSVIADTSATANTQEVETQQKADGGWNGATPFPLIQGTDCCGKVVQVGDNVTQGLMGQRVLVRACMRPNGYDVMDMVWMASNFDGAFAEYVKVPATEIFPISCDWSDEELATVPCAYGTAENMLHRAGVAVNDLVLVAGASGGVGSAAVQLAKRRGAKVVAK
jgi:NADPH:quinone reductase-like Zn-dependent oxidoreductase